MCFAPAQWPRPSGNIAWLCARVNFVHLVQTANVDLFRNSDNWTPTTVVWAARHVDTSTWRVIINTHTLSVHRAPIAITQITHTCVIILMHTRQCYVRCFALRSISFCRFSAFQHIAVSKVRKVRFSAVFNYELATLAGNTVGWTAVAAGRHVTSVGRPKQKPKQKQVASASGLRKYL